MRMCDYIAHVARLPKQAASILKTGVIVVDCGDGPVPLSALCRGLHTLDTHHGRNNMVDFNLAAIGGRMIRRRKKTADDRWRARWVREQLLTVLGINENPRLPQTTRQTGISQC
jgi:hypothetical protein